LVPVRRYVTTQSLLCEIQRENAKNYEGISLGLMLIITRIVVDADKYVGVTLLHYFISLHRNKADTRIKTAVVGGVRYIN